MLDALVVVGVLTASDDLARDGSRSVRCPGAPRRKETHPVVTSVWANPTGEDEEGFAWAATMLPLLLTNAFLDRSSRADVPALMVRVSTPTIELPGARERWTFAEGDPADKLDAWHTQLGHDVSTLNAAWAPLAHVRLFEVPDVSIETDDAGTSFALPALDVRIDWDYVATIPGLLPPAELMCLLRADLLATPAPDQVTRAGQGGPEQAALQSAGRNVATLLPGMWTDTVMTWVNTFRRHPDRLHESLARSAVLDVAADAGVRGITWRDRALVTRRCEPLSYGPLEGVVDANPNPNRAVSRTNPLGMPLPGEPDSEVWDTIAERLGIGLEQWMDHLVDLVDSLAWDRAVVEAGGRWPDPLVARAANEPGDALALRTFAAEHLLARIDNWYEEMNWSKAFTDFTSIASMAPDLMAAAAMVAHAVPFYLPANIAVGVADSRPPDPQMLAELRLPYDLCLITLGAPLLIEPRSVSWHFDATTWPGSPTRRSAKLHTATPPFPPLLSPRTGPHRRSLRCGRSGSSSTVSSFTPIQSAASTTRSCGSCESRTPMTRPEPSGAPPSSGGCPAVCSPISRTTSPLRWPRAAGTPRPATAPASTCRATRQAVSFAAVPAAAASAPLNGRAPPGASASSTCIPPTRCPVSHFLQRRLTLPPMRPPHPLTRQTPMLGIEPRTCGAGIGVAPARVPAATGRTHPVGFGPSS
jgi:hypothetical protein